MHLNELSPFPQGIQLLKEWFILKFSLYYLFKFKML